MVGVVVAVAVVVVCSMRTQTDTGPDFAARKNAQQRKYYAANAAKCIEANRKCREKAKEKPKKIVDPDEVVLAPKMHEEEFWDATSAPLLEMIKAGPMRWVDIEAAVSLLNMNPRFMHHAIAYLDQKGRIHHDGTTPEDVLWFYGPKEETVL